jgi:NAD(P)-dependent dehydrogenase (short-subunit alcohol dehydrogenase family)
MKKVVITGCSSGLGLAMARWGKANGWDVLASVRKAQDAAALEEIGCKVELLELQSSESVQDFATEVINWAPGGINGLVNNAGYVLAAPIEELSRAKLREQFEVNVFGHFELTRLLLPSIRERLGTIIMLSSVSSELTFPLYGPYSASKRALEALTDALAMEVAAEGIKVAVVQPGSHASSIWEKCKSQVEPYFSHPRYGLMAKALQSFAEQKTLPPANNIAQRVYEILDGHRSGYRHILPATSAWQWRFRRWIPDWLYFRAVKKLIQK